MLPWLLLAFIVVPIAELAIIIQVGQEIGVLWTIVLLLADSILGSLLLRSQGRSAWRRFTAALQSGRPPATEVVDGAMVLMGGALLLTPGFLSDLLGILLLLPPTRAVLRRVALKRLIARMTRDITRTAARSRPPGPARATRHPGDIDGTAEDL
jgi:UPF0716 protein FxsA